ncbi:MULTISPECIES: pyridoxal-phosphate dependent enzyme [unclassified Roseivivax]|uniref:pyridoxal-phosphate dependent enzyme n=1 Tax=unclassified Roseivivax TaxID=2639302 RepID=UPI001267995C|nr:pyridoxal-phosphate dependent enzyme [Roseivivax sp. THAF40]
MEIAVAQLHPNPFRATDKALDLPEDIPLPEDDVAPVLALLAQCPAAAETPLVDTPDLATMGHVARLSLKDERGRMGLGSFKALGAAHVIARDAAETGAADLSTALAGRRYVTASAGNHGLSVAAGARIFGAEAAIYLSDTVPEGFADRLRAQGAEVVRAGAHYEASMQAAAQAAKEHGWQLLSDSSWQGYTNVPRVLMQGYLVLMDEVIRQIETPPTHIFVQAGVGGLAAAVAASARKAWGDMPCVIVVEPEAAPCIAASLTAGHAVATEGPVSSMGRLDCKEASLIALKGLARDADAVMTLSDEEAEALLPALDRADLGTTPSGAAGVAALMESAPFRAALSLDAISRVLAFLTETPG